MTRDDNPEYFQHVCEVIQAVFTAEHAMIEQKDISCRLKRREITPSEYVECIAEELIRPTDKNEILNETTFY